MIKWIVFALLSLAVIGISLSAIKTLKSKEEISNFQKSQAAAAVVAFIGFLIAMIVFLFTGVFERDF